MSYPPPSDPNANPPGQPHPPYGQPPPPGYGYPAQQQPAPGYGYPQYPGAPMAGGPMGPMGGAPQSMPGTVVTARVLMFVMGGIWGLIALVFLLLAFSMQSLSTELPPEVAADLADLGAGLAVVVALLSSGMAALTIVPASMFGRGGTGTRVTAIIGASLNTLLALASVSDSPLTGIIWLVVGVLSIVFCSQRQAGAWFGRPRY